MKEFFEGREGEREAQISAKGIELGDYLASSGEGGREGDKLVGRTKWRHTDRRTDCLCMYACMYVCVCVCVRVCVCVYIYIYIYTPCT